LITGAGGQLGRALAEALSHQNATALTHGDLDITEREVVLRVISDATPDLIIHPAAWTDTAGCERDPERARLVNGDAAGYIAEAAREVGAAMVHVSTNEVFDGEKGSPYDEDDATNPINEYGRSKLAGEEAVRAALPEHYIVRTSWLYGPGRVSFPEKVLERARVDGRLKLVTDEIASPTWTVDLAAAIARLNETGEYGTYHLVNDGSCSREEWGEEVVRLAGMDVPIEATTQTAFGLPFRKPVDSTLANNRAATLGIRLRPWREALAEHMTLTRATWTR
jgi:dTDP-4-dehydrorhamnose reductase